MEVASMILVCAPLKFGGLDVKVGVRCKVHTNQDDVDLVVDRGTDDPPVVVR